MSLSTVLCNSGEEEVGEEGGGKVESFGIVVTKESRFGEGGREGGREGGE